LLHDDELEQLENSDPTIHKTKENRVFPKMKIYLTLFLLIQFLIGQLNAKTDEGYCAPYNGKICKSYITSGQVWYSQSGSGGWENEKITTGLFNELIKEVVSFCENAASRMLCAYAFPKCKMVDGKAMKLPLCYEDCIATEKLFCYNDWVLLEQNKDKGNFLKSRGHFRMPECEDLPRHNKSAKVPTCSYVGLIEMNPAEISCEYRHQL